jgi:hypothetical protein
MVEPDTEHNIIHRIRFACWLVSSIGTHSEYVQLIAFSTSTFVTQPHHSVTIICTVSVMFVLFFANYDVDLH